MYLVCLIICVCVCFEMKVCQRQTSCRNQQQPLRQQLASCHREDQHSRSNRSPLISKSLQVGSSPQLSLILILLVLPHLLCQVFQWLVGFLVGGSGLALN